MRNFFIQIVQTESGWPSGAGANQCRQKEPEVSDRMVDQEEVQGDNISGRCKLFRNTASFVRLVSFQTFSDLLLGLSLNYQESWFQALRKAYKQRSRVRGPIWRLQFARGVDCWNLRRQGTTFLFLSFSAVCSYSCTHSPHFCKLQLTMGRKLCYPLLSQGSQFIRSWSS